MALSSGCRQSRSACVAYLLILSGESIPSANNVKLKRNPARVCGVTSCRSDGLLRSQKIFYKVLFVSVQTRITENVERTSIF